MRLAYVPCGPCLTPRDPQGLTIQDLGDLKKTRRDWLILTKAEKRPEQCLRGYFCGCDAHWLASVPLHWPSPCLAGQAVPPPTVPLSKFGRGWRYRKTALKVPAISSLSSWHGRLIVCHWLYAVARLCVCPVGWPEKKDMVLNRAVGV